MKLILVDDHKIVLDGLYPLLRQIDGIDVLEMFTSARKAIKYIESSNGVDLIITDLSMPDFSGIQLIQFVKQHYPRIKIVVLSMHDDQQTVLQTIHQNVDGYLFKDSSFEEIAIAIENVRKDKKYFDSKVSAILTDKLTKKTILTDSNETIGHKFTPREIEILSLLSQGLTQNEIADKLFISPNTVVYHKRKLMSMLGVKNNSGLVKFALVNGFTKI